MFPFKPPGKNKKSFDFLTLSERDGGQRVTLRKKRVKKQSYMTKMPYPLLNDRNFDFLKLLFYLMGIFFS